ncbi:hypothetical protein LOK49_LG01G02699 [Camellia lanceoleosa]|uniref:Uncharacterized protein n=1 Tax=Camellia lanceoleosa TaxID=1840588 RepID=A0ACC0J114_9ERIC|nr:hypothetical protein LOK49_LG01G02699 [Camellia lanceoleosa]
MSSYLTKPETLLITFTKSMADLQSPPPPQSPTDLFGDPIDFHPLWFNQSSFLLPTFDSESYISDLRTFVPFETLRFEPPVFYGDGSISRSFDRTQIGQLINKPSTKW